MLTEYTQLYLLDTIKVLGIMGTSENKYSVVGWIGHHKNTVWWWIVYVNRSQYNFMN